MMGHRRAGHLMAGILTALMLLWLWQAGRLPYLVADRPGPGFFPIWLSAVGLALSIWVLVADIRAQWRARPGDEPPSRDPEEPGSRWAGTLRLVGALFGAVAFVVLMPVLGFVAGLALYLAYLCVAIIRMRVVSGLALSLGTAAAIYLIFDELLAVPFPTGLTGT